MASVTETIAYRANLDAGVHMMRLGQLFATSDHLAHTVKASVVAAGKPADLTGAQVIAYFIREDGETVMIPGTASGNTATVTLPEACYAVPGRFQLIVKATLGDERKAIFWGNGTVTRSTTDTVVDPGDVLPSLEELLAKIGEMEAGTKAANDAASAANAAAGKANASAKNADTATKKANDSASAANEAKEAADAATKRATDAASGVEAATEAANTAANAANQAAASAGEAILAAGEATKAANTAADGANAATAAADEAAGRANSAAEAAEGWANAEASSEDVGPDTPARVEVQTAEDGHKIIVFFLRQGKQGIQGEKGETGSIDNLVINGKQTVDGKIDLTAADVGALALTGGTVSGPLVIGYRGDADGTTAGNPPLIVGGLPTQSHIAFDDNEIMAKADATTPTQLNINVNGGQVVIGSGGLRTGGQILGNLTGNVTGTASGNWIRPVKLWDAGSRASMSAFPEQDISFTGGDGCLCAFVLYALMYGYMPYFCQLIWNATTTLVTANFGGAAGSKTSNFSARRMSIDFVNHKMHFFQGFDCDSNGVLSVTNTVVVPLQVWAIYNF